MEVLSSGCVSRLFDSVMLERSYSADYTTIYHADCDFTFGARWPRKYNYSNGYVSGAKYYTCPHCGHSTNPNRERIYITSEERDVIPLNLWIEVVNYKDFLDLKIKYYGISLTFDGHKIDHVLCCETLRFNFKRRMAVYIDHQRKKHDLTIEFLRSHEVLPVLKFLGKSHAMRAVYKRNINASFKALRIAFEQRIKKTYGFEAKGVYIAPGASEHKGYHYNMLLNMILKIAAPDMPPINVLRSKAARWFNTYGLYDTLNLIPFDDDVLDLTRKGINFHEALRRVHMAPNSRSLRKAMLDDPMCVLMANILNLFKDENCRRRIMTLDRPRTMQLGPTDPYDGLVRNKLGLRDLMCVTTQEVRTMWLSLIERFGERAVVKWVLFTDTDDIRDSLDMYRKLNTASRQDLWSNKFRLKSFHDHLINLFNKQEYGDVHLPSIPSLKADINGMHFMVPKTAADLMQVGKKLRNCVGSYRDRVMQGSTAIVVVTDDRMKPIACLELSKDQDAFTKLVQAKLFGNQRVSRDKNINDTILKWADQLKIEPHTIDIDAQVS